MNKFQKGVGQLLEKRGQMIIGVVGYQYGGHDSQLNDTDYFVCDVDKEFPFGYYASPREFSMKELIFLLRGGTIRETSGHTCPEWDEVHYRTPSL